MRAKLREWQVQEDHHEPQGDQIGALLVFQDRIPSRLLPNCLFIGMNVFPAELLVVVCETLVCSPDGRWHASIADTSTSSGQTSVGNVSLSLSGGTMATHRVHRWVTLPLAPGEWENTDLSNARGNPSSGPRWGNDCVWRQFSAGLMSQPPLSGCSAIHRDLRYSKDRKFKCVPFSNIVLMMMMKMGS